MCQLCLCSGTSGWHSCISPLVPRWQDFSNIIYFYFITCTMMMNVADICIWIKQTDYMVMRCSVQTALAWICCFIVCVCVFKELSFFPSVRTSHCHWSPDTPHSFIDFILFNHHQPVWSMELKTKQTKKQTTRSNPFLQSTRVFAEVLENKYYPFLQIFVFKTIDSSAQRKGT